MRASIFIISAVLGAATLSGCKAATKLLGKAAAEAVTADDDAVGSYIEGYNLLMNKPQRTIEAYFSKVPESGPPANKKIRISVISPTSDLDKVQQAFNTGKEGAGDELKPMVQIAEKTIASAQVLIQSVEEMDKYYAAEDFKDDGGAKAQKLHATFIAEYPNYEKSVAQLAEQLDEVENKRVQEELAEYSDTKAPGYLYRKFNFEAKKLLSEDDPASFSKRFEELEQLQGETEKVAKTDAAGVYKAAFTGYVKMTDNLLSAAKKMKRELSAEKPDPKKLSGLKDDLVSSYNNCVSYANSLRQANL